jgi:hypothetical protein
LSCIVLRLGHEELIY